MKVIFEPTARAELVEAARWYAAEAAQLRAMDFRNEFHRTLALLSEHPLMDTSAECDTRHMVVHRYPYFVVYRSDKDTLHMLAIVLQSRRPAYWAGQR